MSVSFEVQLAPVDETEASMQFLEQFNKIILLKEEASACSCGYS